MFLAARPLLEPLEPRLLLDGGFYGREDIPTGGKPTDIVSADFNGDGKENDHAVMNAWQTADILAEAFGN